MCVFVCSLNLSLTPFTVGAVFTFKSRAQYTGIFSVLVCVPKLHNATPNSQVN